MAVPNGNVLKKQYHYHDLKCLIDVNTSMRGINVIAIVKFFREPHKSRGTSYTMTIGLTDPSLNGGKFICTVFNDVLSRLPQIKCNGDVVIFHRLIVEPFSDRGEIRGSGLPGMGFASAVFDGYSVDAPLKQRSGSSVMNVTDTDLERVMELRRWYHSSDCPVEKESSSTALTNFQSVTNLPSPVVVTVLTRDDSGDNRQVQITSNSLKSLEELNTPNSFFDVVGHVLGMYRVKDDPSCVIIRIWDGTSVQVPTSPFSLQSEERCIPISVLKIPHALWLSRHRFMDVCVFDEHASDESLSGISAGNMVLITNVHLVLSRAASQTGRRYCELRLHGGGKERFGRGIQRVVDTAGDEYVKSVHERLVELHSKCQLTKVAARYQQASSCSLSYILALEPVTWKYKVTARIEGVQPEPNRVLECLHWFCGNCGILKQFNVEEENLEDDAKVAAMERRVCAKCDQVMLLRIVVQILFKDSSGSLLTNIWSKHAVHFFRKYISEPMDLITSEETRQNVALCLKYLPNNEMTFILVSYLPENAHPSERQYQIVDTEIVI